MRINFLHVSPLHLVLLFGSSQVFLSPLIIFFPPPLCTTGYSVISPIGYSLSFIPFFISSSLLFPSFHCIFFASFGISLLPPPTASFLFFTNSPLFSPLPSLCLTGFLCLFLPPSQFFFVSVSPPTVFLCLCFTPHSFSLSLFHPPQFFFVSVSPPTVFLCLCFTPHSFSLSLFHPLTVFLCLCFTPSQFFFVSVSPPHSFSLSLFSPPHSFSLSLFFTPPTVFLCLFFHPTSLTGFSLVSINIYSNLLSFKLNHLIVIFLFEILYIKNFFLYLQSFLGSDAGKPNCPITVIGEGQKSNAFEVAMTA